MISFFRFYVLDSKKGAQEWSLFDLRIPLTY